MCFPNKCSCSWKARTVWGEEPWCIANVLLLGRLLKSQCWKSVEKILCNVSCNVSHWFILGVKKTSLRFSTSPPQNKLERQLSSDILEDVQGPHQGHALKVLFTGFEALLKHWTDLNILFCSEDSDTVKKQILTTKLPRHRTVVSNSQVSWLEF